MFFWDERNLQDNDREQSFPAGTLTALIGMFSVLGQLHWTSTHVHLLETQTTICGKMLSCHPISSATGCSSSDGTPGLKEVRDYTPANPPPEIATAT
jgi:hypothetical protein